MTKHRVHHQKYDMLIGRLLRDETFPQDDDFFTDSKL